VEAIVYSDRDIIVASASEVRKAPLAVIRVSGDNCWNVFQRCFRPKIKKDYEPWRMMYGLWQDGEGVVDDVTVVPYRGPASYTGQDMFEVICHGSALFVDAVVASVIACGGRAARPGEFTMRAVLNGKMDLLEAEGVGALIEANTRFQADLIRRQANGPLVDVVKEQVEAILQVQAHIEATIDYGEEDIDALQKDVLLSKMRGVLGALTELKKTSSFTRSLRRGFRVLLTGRPNVGKSTLFNALVRQERALVTELPGTTRDLVSEEVEIDGLPVVLIDSAGVRETEDRVENLGIEKIYEMLGEVDLVLYLVEQGMETEPYEKIKTLSEDKWIRIRTKADVDEQTLAEEACSVSAKTGQGLDELEGIIVNRLSKVMEGQKAYLINRRQEETLDAALTHLERAIEDFEGGFGEEVLSSYLNTTRRLLGELTGETTVEDILDRMFSNFCLGK
jgi:tRNA modification GTPase